MLHLFNNVFLDHHRHMSVPRGSKVIIFSDVYNTHMNTNENCLICEDTLDDHLGEGTLESFFTETLARTERIVIYANESDFARIITSWLRSSTNMTAVEFETWLSIFKFNSKTNANHYDSLFTAIQSAWNDAVVYDFSAVDYNPSYEFLIASALHDANFSKKSKLISILADIIKTEYEDFVLEVRRNIDSVILDNTVQEALGATSFISNIDMGTITTNFPRLQIFKAPYWTDEINVPTPAAYLTGSSSKLDLSLATQTEINDLLQFTEDFLYTTAGGADAAEALTTEQLGKVFGPRGWAYKDCILSRTLTDEQYNSVLQEMLDESGGLVFYPIELIETVLIQLLPYFRSLKDSNDLTKLQRFTLK